MSRIFSCVSPSSVGVEDDPADVPILNHAAGQSAHPSYVETCTRAEFLKSRGHAALQTPLVAITGTPEGRIDPALYALIRVGRSLFLPKNRSTGPGHEHRVLPQIAHPVSGG